MGCAPTFLRFIHLEPDKCTMRMITRYILAGMMTGLLLVHAQQTTLIDPANEGGFEGTGNAGWMLVSQTGSPNRWCIGSARAPSLGSRCAYISDTTACDRYSYAINSGVQTTVHLYRSITVPAGESFLTLSFKGILRGEGNFDCLEVYLVPQGNPIIGGQNLPQTQRLFRVVYDPDGFEPGAYIASYTDWTPITHYTCAEPGSYFLVFSWKNDLSTGNNPPIAIDEVSLISSAQAPDPVAALGSGVTSVTNFPYNHTPVPATTCGQRDDIQVFNTRNACSGNHLDSEDRVWGFTAPQNGCLEVTFTGDTTDNSGAWRYFGLQLFEGNPVACGRCVASHTTSQRARRTLQANVTSGQKYYLLLDGDAPPACGRFLELRMTITTGPCATALAHFSEREIQWTLSPSPAREQLSVRGSVERATMLYLQVFSTTGQKVYESAILPIHDSFSHEISLNGWTGGLYIARLSGEGVSVSRSFIVE